MLGGLAQVEDPYTAPYDRSMMRTNPSYQPRSLVISPPSRPSPGCVRGGCLAQIGSPKKGNDIITDVLEVKDTKP
jgi:hypothetical protein